jgi:DNA-binding beta-propeller fold protein YncE
VLLQSPEAINILPTVRIFQNNRNAEARGTVLPIDYGASTSGLADMVQDSARQRLYIANPGLNRLEVFDMQKKTFLAPIAVGQLPRSMAFGNDGNTLYVASGGGETITIVDLSPASAASRSSCRTVRSGISWAIR